MFQIFHLPYQHIFTFAHAYLSGAGLNRQKTLTNKAPHWRHKDSLRPSKCRPKFLRQSTEYRYLGDLHYIGKTRTVLTPRSEMNLRGDFVFITLIYMNICTVRSYCPFINNGYKLVVRRMNQVVIIWSIAVTTNCAFFSSSASTWGSANFSMSLSKY